MEFEEKIELLRESIDTLDDLFYVFDKNGNFLYWNKTVQKITGYTQKEIESMSPSDFFEGKDKEKIRNAIEKTIKTGESRIEANLKTKNGEKIPYEFKISHLKNKKIEVICGIGRNIKERKKYEKHLQNKNNLLRSILETSIDGILVVDKNRKIKTYNSRFIEMFDIPDKIINKKEDKKH